MQRVAVITDIHANLPALEGGASAHRRARRRRRLLRRGPGRLRPSPQRGVRLIDEREIPTIYGNYDYAIARDLEDCGCAYVTPHDRELGQQSVDWTLEHTDTRREGVHARAALRPALRPSGETEGPSRSRLAAQGQRVPLRGQAARSLRAHGRRPTTATSSSSAIPTSPGSTSTAACCSSTAARSASPRTATRAAPSRSSKPPTTGVRVRIERVEYDAEAVAREVAAAGLPEEFADKLLSAACRRDRQ